MKRILLFIFLLPLFVKAQRQQAFLDSLNLTLKNATNDTLRMDVYSSLGRYYYSRNTDSVNYYLEQSAIIAHGLNLKLNEAIVLQSRAYNLIWSNYPKALDLLSQALKITDDPASEKNAWNLPNGLTPHKARLNLLGFIYFDLAQLYGNTGNIDKQVSSLFNAVNIAESVNDAGLSMVTYLNIGGIYLDKFKKLDSALYFEKKALSFFPVSKDSFSVGWAYNGIGKIYQEKGNFDLSRDAFQKGLMFMQGQHNLAGVGNIYLSISSFYQKNNKPDSSLWYAYKALETYELFKDRGGVADAYASISSAFDKQKNIDSAFVYLTLATALNDSLHNAERKNLIDYQNAIFSEQIRLKNLEAKRIQTQTKIKTYVLLAGIIVFMLIAFLLYRNNRNRKKANELLEIQKEEIAKQKDNAEQTLAELKSTQQQLVQSEKMASLGELTAGIAHEIQNPLNFVNNFSEVNKEMLEELKAERLKPNAERDEQLENELLNNIKDNEEKINHHGKRADAIVKGMLQHSRQTKGTKEPTDINALCDEYLRLSYHGLRAKDKNFNADFKTDFDESIGKVNVVPQDVGRVLLNLFNNAFYAVNEKKKLMANSYQPLAEVKTRRINDKVEITVSDNGNGIPSNIIDKIFQPFFTTKPTGEGTGLGLSLAYDIITKEHNASINVESKESEGSKFVIQLPFERNIYDK